MSEIPIHERRFIGGIDKAWVRNEGVIAFAAIRCPSETAPWVS